MSRGAHTFKQRDVERAIKACRRAGETVFRVEIADGKMIIVVGAAAKPAEDDDVQRWLKSQGGTK